MNAIMNTFRLAAVAALVLAMATFAGVEARGVTIIGHWAFEEGTGSIAYDSSPNHLDGTIVNAAYTNVTDPTLPALGTYALAFNGLDTYVEVGNNPLLAPATIGISLWFKCGPQAAYHDLLDKGHGFGSTPYFGGYAVQGYPGNLEAIYGNGADFYVLGTGPGVYDDMWHLLVANLGQDAIEVYVDTIPVAGGGPGAGPIVQNDSDLFFGRHSAVGRYYNGLIADVRLYDGALSQQDVIALFNPPEPIPEPATMVAGLLGLGSVAAYLKGRSKV